MAIRVGHNTGADAVAAAAFGGGVGQARQRLVAGGLLAGERERARLAEIAEAERQRQLALEGQTTQQALMRTNYDLQQQSAQAAQDRELEGFERTFTTRQRLQAEQWADAEAKALADPAFTAQDKAEIKHRFAQLRAGMTPVARPKPPTPAELFARNTFTDPKTGNVYALDEKGTISQRPIHERPEREPSWQDRLKAREIAMKMATSPEGVVDPKEAARLYAELMGEAAQAPGAAPAVAAGVPAAASSVAAPTKPAVDPRIAEAEKALAEAKAKAGGLLTKEVKTAQEALKKQQQAVHEERAYGVADKDTPEGLELRLAQIGTADSPAGVNREAGLDPKKVQNLATARYQILAANVDLKEAEDKAVKLEAEAKELNNRARKLRAAAGPLKNSDALIFAETEAQARAQSARSARAEANARRERVDELNKRKKTLESERELVETRMTARLAAASMASGGAVPASMPATAEAPAAKSGRVEIRLNRDERPQDHSVVNRGDVTIRNGKRQAPVAAGKVTDYQISLAESVVKQLEAEVKKGVPGSTKRLAEAKAKLAELTTQRGVR